jgi:hypothetical protein
MRLPSFQPEIAFRNADAFYSKEQTIAEKQQTIMASQAEFEVAQQSNLSLTDTEIEKFMIKK